MSDRVTMQDVHACGMCSLRTRRFCITHGIDFKRLAHEGLPIEEVEEIAERVNDALLNKVLEKARGR